MILVIVYVGAVAVLFLFVVMMLDVNFSQVREGLQRYAPVGAAIGVVLFAEIVLTVSGWQIAPHMALQFGAPTPAGVTNTAALGRVIYTQYVFLFQAAGLVLLVAMIGAIVLTHRERLGAVRRQDIGRQNARTAATTLEVMTVALGVGTNQTGILRPLAEPQPAAEPEHEPAHAHHSGEH